ncbi:hypothetical protein Ddye_001633 [Dipteronia dyeriana]|uniref:Reverse transcriptase domain-containing protein n=1 Tax=Dipteronia dyeriana TaxID=168575 RepID=A0AAD9XNW8_9ROSI|nr:hypothetical protein Ddye_001633 [Dipteronia dyeriana]
MDSVISPTQMAFLKDRHIIDSFVIAEEVIHSWKKKGNGGLLVKLDFQKAYDTVDHDFCLSFGKEGLGSKWCSWIKWCISSSSLSV